MLDAVKLRCGVPSAITVYDTEFKDLISDALEDMRTAGIPETLLEDKGANTNPRVLTAVSLYVKAMRGDDRTDTSDALEDMRTAGIPETLLEDKGANTNPRVLTAVSLYVKAMRGDDRTDTDMYLNLYHKKVFKLQLEPVQEVM